MIVRYALNLCAAILSIGIAQAQDETEIAPIAKPRLQAEVGTGVVLRGMDKISGDVVEFNLTPNQTKQVGRIQVTLQECRYPKGNLSRDAFAYLTIRGADAEETSFEGWMIASSPALNALDHPRYDIWVIRCTTS